MKALGMFLVGLLAMGSTPASAQVKCGPFSLDPGCQRSASPNVQVDFTKGQKFETLVRPESRLTPDRHFPGGPVRQAIDCQMIRSADRNLDPRMVKAPPSAVNHTLRVVEAPACPTR